VQVNSIKKLNKDFFKMIGYSEEEAEQKMLAEWDIEQRIGTTSLNQMENRDKILANASLEDLKSYVELQIIRTYSGYLFNA
jgi:putative endopeptidase